MIRGLVIDGDDAAKYHSSIKVGILKTIVYQKSRDGHELDELDCVVDVSILEERKCCVRVSVHLLLVLVGGRGVNVFALGDCLWENLHMWGMKR